MAFEHKPGFGSLFKNQRKSKPNHPDYEGGVNVGGALYKLAGWIKQGKNGSFLSISIKPDDNHRGGGNDDDISF